MKIENINEGLCHRRVQEDKPPFVVCWTQGGKGKSRFFEQRFAAADFKKNLELVQSGVLEIDLAKSILKL